jgi:hypothetical protein
MEGMNYREKMMSRKRRWEGVAVIVLGIITILAASVIWNRGGSIGGPLLQGGGARVPVGPQSRFAVGMALFGLVLAVGGVLRLGKGTSNTQ